MAYRYANDFWGPAVWTSIHSFAMAYEPSPENARAFKQFIESLIYLLPCCKCRAHLKQNLKQLPLEPNLGSKDKLFKWSFDLHDLVNKQLEKPRPDYAWAEKYYNQKIFI